MKGSNRRDLEVGEELKEPEKSFQVLFTLMPDPAAIVDAKGKILAVNDRVEEVTLFKREELVGKNFLELEIMTAKSKAIAIKNLAKRMMGMQVAPYEVEILTKDGQKLWVEINAREIEYEGKQADLVVFRDITERKRMEDELRQRSEDIKTLNEGITQRLIQKIGQIDNISKLRDRLRKSPDISTGIDLILDTALNDLEMDVGAVLIIDREENAIKLQGFKSRIEGMKVDERYPLYIELAEFEALKENKKISKILGQDEPSILKTASIHCAPILLGKEAHGILIFGSQKDLTLDRSDLAVLGLYSELASTLFETQSLTITPMKEVARVSKRRFELELGRSYLVKNDVEKAFQVFADHVLSGLEGLCITREFPPNVRRKYGLEKTPIVWLTEERAKGEMTVDSLQDLSILIQRFLENTKRSVVLLDGFEYLTTKSGFESFIRFLQLNRSRFEKSESILVAPVLEEALDLREAKLVEREMRPLIAE